MQNKPIHKIICLLLCILLTGCSAAPSVPSVDTRSGADDSYELYNLGGAGSQPDVFEKPSIDDMVVLSDLYGDAEVQDINLDFSGSTTPSTNTSEMRAIWISYLEMDHLLKNKSESQFKNNISAVFDDVRDLGLNTVIVQVRPFGDALYDSEYFPWSYTITGTEGKDPGFDPLSVMVSQAKDKGLRIEAWINPYRVRAAGNTKPLSSDNQAKKWIDAGDGAVIQYNGVTSYNPASEKARTLIVNGVREIVRNYNVDGIHIDDYFYPTTDTAFDSSSYNSYKNNGGTMSLANWRRDNVEKLIKAMYSAVKEEKSTVKFGISPAGNIDNNYSQLYLDVEKIGANSGYCDYIAPQIYWGYNHQTMAYESVVKRWNNTVTHNSVDLYIGIAAYKIGTVDSYAGGTGANEWKNSNTQMKDMVETARDASGCNGFILYRYDSLFNPDSTVSTQVNKEVSNLKKIL